MIDVMGVASLVTNGGDTTKYRGLRCEGAAKERSALYLIWVWTTLDRKGQAAR